MLLFINSPAWLSTLVILKNDMFSISSACKYFSLCSWDDTEILSSPTPNSWFTWCWDWTRVKLSSQISYQLSHSPSLKVRLWDDLLLALISSLSYTSTRQQFDTLFFSVLVSGRNILLLPSSTLTTLSLAQFTSGLVKLWPITKFRALILLHSIYD